MDKLILLCLTFLARTNSKSAPVPSTEALLTGLPKLIHLQTAVPFSLEYPTTWVTGDSGFFLTAPLSLHAASPLGCKIIVPWSIWDYSTV